MTIKRYNYHDYLFSGSFYKANVVEIRVFTQQMLFAFTTFKTKILRLEIILKLQPCILALRGCLKLQLG